MQTDDNLNKEDNMIIPTAQRHPVMNNHFGDVLTDNYAWLRDQNWPDVQDKKILAYLNDENKYAEEYFKNASFKIDDIYQEIIGRVQLKDMSVPIKDGKYYYYSRTEEDSKYPIVCRKKDNLNNPEEIIIDSNLMAGEQKYFSLNAIEVSEDDNLLGYSVDIKGDERYEINIKDLRDHSLMADKLTSTTGRVVWDMETTGFFYVLYDENWRANKVFYHKLNTAQSDDVLIYHETDPLFRVSARRSSDDQYLFIVIGSQDTSETRYVALKGEDKTLKIWHARHTERQYDIDHAHGRFYMHTNDKGKNFRLVSMYEEEKDISEKWQEIIAHDADIFLLGFDLYRKHLIVEKSIKGLTHIEIAKSEDLLNNMKKFYEIKFSEEAYSASVVSMPYDTDEIRVDYSSLRTPNSVLAYDLGDYSSKILKEQIVKGDFDKNNYLTKRIYATARDGAQVPISLVYHKDKFKTGAGNPLFLYGYGSYGSSVDPYFRSSIISLLDRGFVYAIAHIRGGSDLGYHWYEDGKLLKKKNTFDDFIACAEHLIKEKYTKQGEIAIRGGSAGGMLVGAVLNMRPELFKAAVAEVPFVDVLNTMLDENLPLTPGEYVEWGNPKEEEFYHYIKSYSPYDNIKKMKYPAIYATAGLTDPRVTYWEPAKWVAKLREYNQNKDQPILLKTNMIAGHGGATNRFDSTREIAEAYVFLLEELIGKKP